MQTSYKVQLSYTANDDDADEDPVKPWGFTPPLNVKLAPHKGGGGHVAFI